jgi:hypothetical protein
LIPDDQDTFGRESLRGLLLGLDAEVGEVGGVLRNLPLEFKFCAQKLDVDETLLLIFGKICLRFLPCLSDEESVESSIVTSSRSRDLSSDMSEATRERMSSSSS